MKITLSFWLVVFSTFINLYVYTQREVAKKWIDSLTSFNFHGRGYVENGDMIASNFIKSVATENKEVKPIFGSSYTQSFNIDVNTFPEKVEISIKGKKIVPGIDFIVRPNSGSAYGKHKVVQIESFKQLKDLTNVDLSDNVVFLLTIPMPKDRDSLMSYYSAQKKLANMKPVMVINDEKFTWSVSQNNLRNPIIEIKSELMEGVNEVELNITNVFIDDYKTQNLGFLIEGKSKGGEMIVFSAHYDHLGEMGKGVYFPGANDNASGTAMLLSLMNYYANNKPKYNIVFLFFGAEEVGLLGSKYFVENSPIDLSKIKCLLNLDIFGTGDEGVTVVNATEFPDLFSKLLKINSKNKYLPQVKKRGKAANSDHYWFTELGVPSFFIYTMGGVSYYHDVLDKAETLPLTKFNEIHDLLIKFTKKIK